MDSNAFLQLCQASLKQHQKEMEINAASGIYRGK